MDKSPKVHSGHWQRTRDRILSIPKTEFTDIDVLEGLLQLVFTRGDTNEIARQLLYKFHNIAFIVKASPEDLQMVDGIGKVASEKLALLFKSVDFIQCESNNVVYKTPSNVNNAVQLIKNHFEINSKEKLQAFYLDENNILLGQPIIGEGELNKVGIDYGKIVDFAYRYKALKVIIVHNHPSNNVMPSKEDFYCTSTLYATLRSSGFRLVDHIIVAREKFFSFHNSRIISLISENYERVLKDSLNLSKLETARNAIN